MVAERCVNAPRKLRDEVESDAMGAGVESAFAKDGRDSDAVGSTLSVTVKEDRRERLTLPLALRLVMGREGVDVEPMDVGRA